MEWAKRRLQSIESPPSHSLSSAFENLRLILARLGVDTLPSGSHPDSNPSPGKFTQLLRAVFGETATTRSTSILRRTFHEFLGVLEESINSELHFSMQLFAQFEAIDKQFLNLHRTVARESDFQAREEEEVLSSLWAKVMGANAATLRKFERNRTLLASLKAKTVASKSTLMEHNQQLLRLKSSLEVLRRKLVSPLVRRNESEAGLGVGEQIRGLEDTYGHLRRVREVQKQKTLEMMFSSRKKVGEIPAEAYIG